jgi:hypothetical protein
MAVTDLTDSLPYWARQGVGGPGPTGGPGSAPMGAGNSASWLQYLQQMFGVSPANAAENSPVAALASLSDGNDGNNPYQAAARANPAQGGPYVGSGAPPMAAANVAQPPQNPLLGSMNAPAGPGGGIGSDMRFPLTQQGPDYQTQQPDPRLLPVSAAQPSSAAPSAANPLAVAGPRAAGPVPGPLASGGATASGASANPRFVQLDQGQNMDPTARNRGPQMTALNLAGLFGGGAPGAPRGVNPANLPAPAAQTVAGPLAGGGRLPGGRFINPQPPGGPPDYGMAPVDITGYPVAGVNATRSPDMTPDQLASAVKKRNWYRNV